MELRVFYHGSSEGTVGYGIEDANRITGGRQNSRTRARLKELRPRISAMAQAQLGSNFESLEFLGNEALLLRVKVGTAKQKHFAMRDLFGWINLFDAEPRRPAR